MGLSDKPAMNIINKLSKTLKKRNIKTFLEMISHIKDSLNEYYNTLNEDEKKIALDGLVSKFRKHSGGTVKKQKPKKQKTLRKNNSFRKKRKAKV